jgi:hypothetical protein
MSNIPEGRMLCPRCRGSKGSWYEESNPHAWGGNEYIECNYCEDGTVIDSDRNRALMVRLDEEAAAIRARYAAAKAYRAERDARAAALEAEGRWF